MAPARMLQLKGKPPLPPSPNGGVGGPATSRNNFVGTVTVPNGSTMTLQYVTLMDVGVAEAYGQLFSDVPTPSVRAVSAEKDRCQKHFCCCQLITCFSDSWYDLVAKQTLMCHVLLLVSPATSGIHLSLVCSKVCDGC
jgi:hypothetical protein